MAAGRAEDEEMSETLKKLHQEFETVYEAPLSDARTAELNRINFAIIAEENRIYDALTPDQKEIRRLERQLENERSAAIEREKSTRNFILMILGVALFYTILAHFSHGPARPEDCTYAQEQLGGC
jgi:hypothetical protein